MCVCSAVNDDEEGEMQAESIAMFGRDERHGNDRRASRGNTHNHKFQRMDFRLHQAHHLQPKEIQGGRQSRCCGLFIFQAPK